MGRGGRQIPGGLPVSCPRLSHNDHGIVPGYGKAPAKTEGKPGMPKVFIGCGGGPVLFANRAACGGKIAYVNPRKKIIRTAFKADEHAPDAKRCWGAYEWLGKTITHGIVR